jgi:hypothetical protein
MNTRVSGVFHVASVTLLAVRDSEALLLFAKQGLGCYFTHSNKIFVAQTDHCSINSELDTEFPLFITPVEAIMHISFLLDSSRIYIFGI